MQAENFFKVCKGQFVNTRIIQDVDFRLLNENIYTHTKHPHVLTTVTCFREVQIKLCFFLKYLRCLGNIYNQISHNHFKHLQLKSPSTPVRMDSPSFYPVILSSLKVRLSPAALLLLSPVHFPWQCILCLSSFNPSGLQFWTMSSYTQTDIIPCSPFLHPLIQNSHINLSKTPF